VKQAGLWIALMSFSVATGCKKDPPRPPPDPNAWLAEVAKLKPFLPPALGPCTSTASVETMQIMPTKGSSEYEATRAYDCAGRAMELGIHAGNISHYATESDGRGNFGSDSKTTYKDVMLGGGRGILMMDARKSELDLVLGSRLVITASMIDPSPPDEVIPIVNKLDFKGLAAISLNDVP
jgi:hypothetical protein